MSTNQRPHGAEHNAPVPQSRSTEHHGFGRMFPNINAPEMVLKLDACARIGAKMTGRSEEARPDSGIPAGYTYFGQFVDHDLSFDRTEELLDQVRPNGGLFATQEEMLLQGRSPQLDLDSLYSKPLAHDAPSPFEGAKFKIGMTTPVEGDSALPVERALPYDLPRYLPRNSSANDARTALIGDPRNDENLAVAQTHLMWLKFHNRIADQISKARPFQSESAVFAEAKDLVVKHYQYVIIHDFLSRFVQPQVMQSVFTDKRRKFLALGRGEIPFMPLEFSVAAYRHGHSQVRERYSWNTVFENSPFSLLFLFSQVSGGQQAFNNNATLPTNWIADFRRLYDFGEATFAHLEHAPDAQLNFAKKLDPYLAASLGDLPELHQAVAEGRLPFSNLAALNIRKGSLRGLPSGQDLARSISTVKTLSPSNIRSVLDPDFIEELEFLGFIERTPLWLYILIEAAQTDDDFLGELGSIIVAETFYTMILTSKGSILGDKEDWHPELALDIIGGASPLNSIPDILSWIDEFEPIIDPLRDRRIQPNTWFLPLLRCNRTLSAQ